MDVTTQHASRHSEKEFSDKLTTFVDSGAGVIHVRAAEVLRAAYAVRKQAVIDGASVKEWDVVNGFRDFTVENISYPLVKGDDNIDFTNALFEPLRMLQADLTSGAGDNVRYFIYVGAQEFLENNPQAAHLLLTYCHVLPSVNIVVVLITPDKPLPAGVDETIMSIRLDTPGLSELKDSLADIVDNVEGAVELDDDEVNRVCYVGAGMTKSHFETYAALSIIEAAREGTGKVTADSIIKGVTVGKTEVVNSTDILELYPTTSIADVGGLQNLKRWIRDRRGCYSDAAKDFGVAPPKGIVLVGVPGTGKSLVAKAMASELGVPLVRLDMGRVFNSLVGASEQRMRTALRQVELMSPAALLVDEIDKGLGGIGGSGDSGVSSRVLGTLLTWLQDSNYPVFTIATANNINGLPPEMLRRGRFDAIFATTLPSPEERREVLSIHLKRRGRDIKAYPRKDVEAVLAASEGYVPAEVESAVKDALVAAFNQGDELTMQHVVDALRSMVPLSKTYAAQIKAMMDWAAANATPAGFDPLQANAKATKKVAETGTRVMRRRPTH